MAKQKILEIEGVWTAETIEEIKSWIVGDQREQEIKELQLLAGEQAKQIHEIAHVDLNELKVPFTFNM